MGVEDRTKLDKYPSWRDALFGQDTVANLRCAAEYVVWLGMYLVLLVVGLAILSVVYPLKKAHEAIQGILPDPDPSGRVDTEPGRIESGLDSASEWLNRVLENERVKDAAEWAFIGAFILAVIAFVGLIVFSLYTLITEDPMALVYIVGGSVAILGGIYGFAVLHDWWVDYSREHHPIQRAKNRAVETPGIRRVYGKCPVSFDVEPKFFQNAVEWIENRLD